MKIKTTELEGAALDWAVAQCEEEYNEEMIVSISMGGRVNVMIEPDTCYHYRPSTDWSQCGPLIERYNIHLECGPLDKVGAQVSWEATVMDFETMTCDSAEGDTPLVAVCRAVVCGLIGDTVEVPESLL